MKKIVCVLLAGLMLVSAVACANTNEPTGETTPTSSPLDTSAVAEEETKDPNYVCDLPDDFRIEGKREINMIYVRSDYTEDELISGGTGSVVSNAVHERNIAVEEQLGITIKLHPEDSATNVTNEVNRDIMGGDGAYELVANGTYLSVLPAMEGKYVNLSNLSNIDTSKHYWTQGYNDMVTFTDQDMQFLASGSAAITMFRLMYLTLYNKQIFADRQLTDLYDTVKAGEWTLDYQYSLTTGLYRDEDGDKRVSEGDFYGFVTGDIVSVDPYCVAADVHLIVKDEDTSELTFNGEALTRLSDLCDKVQKLYNDAGTYVYKTADRDDVPKTNIINHFNNQRAMMVTTMFWQMEHNFEALSALTYGIAPIPKFDTLQESYYSYVQDQVTSFGISAAVADIGRQNELAAVLELLAYHSYNIVRPAYYETALSERYMQDPQSGEILDMIFDTLQFDFSSSCSNIFTGSVIRDNLRPILSGRTNTVASSTSRWSDRYNRELTSTYNPKLEDLMDN